MKMQPDPRESISRWSQIHPGFSPKVVQMSQKTVEEIQGYEFDWLAFDEDGHVALFSTGGGGYAPSEFLADTEAFDGAVEALLALTSTTTAELFPEVEDGLPNTWKEVAKRGLFAFDSDYLGGPYRCVGVPRRRAFVEELPAPVAEVVRRIWLKGVHFDSAKKISADELQRAEKG